MLPTSLIAKPPDEPVTSSVPFVVNLQDAIRDAHDRVRLATKKAARVQRKYYDEKSRRTTFREGQLVWLLWPQPPIRQKFKKLRKVWAGPWKIEEFPSPLVVKIRHVNKRTRQTVHVDRLISCLTPQALDEPEDSLVNLFGDGEHPSTVEPSLQPDAPLEETQDFESQPLGETQLSQRPTRTRRLPTALEPYILG